MVTPSFVEGQLPSVQDCGCPSKAWDDNQGRLLLGFGFGGCGLFGQHEEIVEDLLG